MSPPRKDDQTQYRISCRPYISMPHTSCHEVLMPRFPMASRWHPYTPVYTSQFAKYLVHVMERFPLFAHIKGKGRRLSSRLESKAEAIGQERTATPSTVFMPTATFAMTAAARSSSDRRWTDGAGPSISWRSTRPARSQTHKTSHRMYSSDYLPATRSSRVKNISRRGCCG